MDNILVVVDTQNDFITGALGTPEAVQVVDKIVDKIKSFNGTIIATQDTHSLDTYLESPQGIKLPVPHCIEHTDGWQYEERIFRAFREIGGVIKLKKSRFASTMLLHILYTVMGEYDKEFNIEFVGLCTDICVISNAIMIESVFPKANVIVDASCCAGSTPERHRDALNIMKSCQIEVINDIDSKFQKLEATREFNYIKPLLDINPSAALEVVSKNV